MSWDTRALPDSSNSPTVRGSNCRKHRNETCRDHSNRRGEKGLASATPISDPLWEVSARRGHNACLRFRRSRHVPMTARSQSTPPFVPVVGPQRRILALLDRPGRSGIGRSWRISRRATDLAQWSFLTHHVRSRTAVAALRRATFGSTGFCFRIRQSDYAHAQTMSVGPRRVSPRRWISVAMRLAHIVQGSSWPTGAVTCPYEANSRLLQSVLISAQRPDRPAGPHSSR
jgi:hypothetical protein